MQLPLRRAVLAGAFFAMLNACAASAIDDSLPPEPDPVAVERIVVQRTCPAELLAPVPPLPQPGSDSLIETNEAGMNWVGAIVDHALMLADRLLDAAGECN